MSAKNKNMLIIDDNEIDRSILSYLFCEEYEIIEASNGSEALEILSMCQDNINIILLDLIMPEMDGMTFLDKKNASESTIKNIPLVMITSDDRVETQIKAFDKGANDFISKPFVPEIVTSRIKNVLKRDRTMKSLLAENNHFKIQSEIDQMTGVYNKVTTENMIDKELSTNDCSNFALMVIDVDHFKSVNDIEGHLVGDHILQVISSHIKHQFRTSDIIGRIGGDEFVVLMKDIPTYDIARMKGDYLARSMKNKDSMSIPERVTISIGLAFASDDSKTYETLFAKADEALQAAKSNGRGRMCEFGVKLSESVDDKRNVILMLTLDRSVSSIIQAVYGRKYRILEINKRDQLINLPLQIKSKTVLSFIDISADKDNGKFLIDDINQNHNWIIRKPFLAICDEGNMNQFNVAMSVNVSDIITVPLDMATLKRRTNRHLSKS